MPVLSLTTRTEYNAQATDDVPVVLVEIIGVDGSHYISSDPTIRLSTDPLRYGTRHKGRDYEFVLMRVAWPDDQAGKPPSTTLLFENVVADMAAVARLQRDRFDVELTLVMSNAPDVIEDRAQMICTGSNYDAMQLSLDVSREPIESEPWPAQRMTRERFPGLFR
jgi:hypothetical protein